jgi:hypothetical protein
VNLRAPIPLSALLLAAVLCLPTAARAEVRAYLDPPIIDELDVTRLTILVPGARATAPLDLQELRDDFDVLTTQSSSQFRSVNNQVASSVEYQVTLRPRRSGILTIPPLTVGDVTTPPVRLQVQAMDGELRTAIDRMVFFESELSVNPVYVNAQTVLTRRLYYSSDAQIYSDLPPPPKLTGAVVTPLGPATSAVVLRDGRRYGVIEERFAIVPEESGTLTVPAISITTSVRLDTGARPRRAGVRVAAEALDVTVLPIPASYPPNLPWLPAENVVISDEWSPSDRFMNVGDPVSRTVRAEVIGNVSSVIPPLDTELPDRYFRQYPEPPRLQDDPDGDVLRGSRSQTYSLIATAPGTITLPPVELVWWDVTHHRLRTSRVPPRSLTIAGSAAAPRTDPLPEPSSATAVTDVDVRDEQVPWPGTERRRGLWLILLALAGLALAVWIGNRVIRPSGNLAPGNRVPSERDRWRDLKEACRSGNQQAMHRALLAYLRCHFDTSLPEAQRRFRNLGHGALMERLTAALYREGDEDNVSGRELLRAVRTLQRRPRRRAGDPLPALYD